jgi:hypothetical protein
MDFKNIFIEFCKSNSTDIHVGSVKPIATDSLIKLAERRIGHVFPVSYKDFLYEFCFAEIFGEEVFSLYPGYYENNDDRKISYPGDISYQYLVNKKKLSKSK